MLPHVQRDLMKLGVPNPCSLELKEKFEGTVKTNYHFDQHVSPNTNKRCNCFYRVEHFTPNTNRRSDCINRVEVEI